MFNYKGEFKAGDVVVITQSDFQAGVGVGEIGTVIAASHIDGNDIYTLEMDGDGATVNVSGHILSEWAKFEKITPNPNPDAVNHPDHYTDGGIETIEYLRVKLTADEFRGYIKGNVIKYMSRAGKKGDSDEDMAKAKKYLELYFK